MDNMDQYPIISAGLSRICFTRLRKDSVPSTSSLPSSITSALDVSEAVWTPNMTVGGHHTAKIGGVMTASLK